ncbi:MAG TPA: hypothetical protein VM513_08130 [Kofleriaceae bacterium]|nr:hypothetical protein [Kofleriaceae bacterium]
MLSLRRSTLLAVAASTLALAACGDDGGSNTPDAPPQPDAPSCTAIAVSDTPVFNENSDDSFIMWSQPVSTSLGSGDTLLNFEFYGGIESSLAGTIDLTTGNQNNYATCAACFRVIVLNAAGDDIEKQFFQSGGSVTLATDPLTSRVMMGTTTDLTLTEVTVADDYTSTPVAGGVCLSLGSINLMADSVPAAWTCPKDQYADGTTCNCECGAHDPDCDIDNAPVGGCTGAQVCGVDDTCVDACDVLATPAVGCPAGVCGYETADRDICYTDTTLVDAAALGGTCTTATALFCGVSNTVATGLCDKFEGDDLGCREACDATADCATGEVCAPLIGTKGLCVTAPLNDTCETATPLVIGTPVTGSTAGAASNYNMGLETAACTGASQAGGDIAYSVTLTANQAITVTVSAVSPNFDPSVAIVGPGAGTVCNASPIACLKGADAGLDGAGETFMYTATTAGVYYIIVDTFYQRQGGKFTLAVTSP